MKNFPPKKKETERQEIYDDKEDNQKDINVYNDRNKRVSESKQTKSSSNMKGRSSEEKKNYKNKQNKYNEKYEDDNGEYDENYPNYKMNQMKRNKNSRAMLNFRYNERNDNYLSESVGTNMEENSYDSESPRRRRKLKVEFLKLLLLKFSNVA